MALIKKITLSNTTYDLGADADNIAYNSNNSVKDKIDGYDEIVPSSASSSNKLATMNDIPSLTNYIEKSQTAGLIKNDGTIDTNIYATSSDMSEKEDKPTILSATLAVGETSVVISNAAIHATSYFDTYTDVYGVNPTDITAAEGSLTLTFEAQESVVNIRVKVSQGGV